MREGDTVNVFDRAVAAVAPVHAAKRAAARAALKIIDSGYGNYGANLTKKSLRGWEFYGGSAKEDIEDNIDILRQRSRDAYMGIPTASAALKTINVRVTVTEKKKVTMLAKKCGLSLSEYLRQRALGYEPGGHPPKEVFDILDKLDEIAENCSAREGAAINAQTDRMRDLLIGGN